jgi:hypothetical protein
MIEARLVSRPRSAWPASGSRSNKPSASATALAIMTNHVTPCPILPVRAGCSDWSPKVEEASGNPRGFF